MPALSVVYRSIAALKPRAANPRTHSKKQIQQIAASIQKFGFTNPVLVDDANGIIAGHGRLEAAKLLDMAEVPTLRLSGMSEDDIRAYVIADNRLAELAGWDRKLLGLELQYLAEINFEVPVIGFEAAEVDVLIEELNLDVGQADAADQIPARTDGPAVTRPGDVWVIGGKHRLICADANDAGAYARLLGEERAQMVLTDPPYNVPVGGHVSGLGEIQHREFAMASGEMSKAEFTSFLSNVFARLAAASADGSIHFVFMDWRHLGEVLAAGEAAYTELKNLCVWAKTNGGMGSLYRSQHELCFVFKAGAGAHINNVELGKHGRNRTNVWTYAGVNSFGEGRDDLKLHPTVKPVAMIKDAILDCSTRGAIVLDAFAGSGSTLIAAHQAGRRGYGIEIDAAYCDVIVKRMQAVCGLDAVLEATGQSFEAAARERDELSTEIHVALAGSDK